MQVNRPILRYHGGKWLLSKWIISHFPKHRIYVEPYGGAASVLLRKKRCYSEVYNDLDDEVYNLFCVVRDQGQKLKELLELTPFSRKEFIKSYELSHDPLERARRTIVRSFMGFSSGSVSRRNFGSKSVGFRSKGGYSGSYGKPQTGFRSCSNRNGTVPAHDFKNYSQALAGIIDRLRDVVIENKDAISVIKQHDTSNTLHYLDPPYVLNTRYKGNKTKIYQYEMTDDDHAQMIQVIQDLQGMVILSGYDNQLYNDELSGWTCVKRSTYADGAKKRVECLWLNEHAVEAKSQLNLFTKK